MYKLNDYLRIEESDGSKTIAKVHTVEPLIVKTLDGRLLFAHEFQVLEQLTLEEVSELLTLGK